jgi:NADH-quinone oxidoreductase subunit D
MSKVGASALVIGSSFGLSHSSFYKGFVQVEAYEGDEMILNMGPQHPSTHGVLRLELQTDGEVVQKITPHIGYLHRCFEKHAENVDYPGVIPYTDRMDYIASMNNSLGYALAVEKLMGIEVNDRVKTLRIIVAELNRIASHLLSVGTYAMDIGAYLHSALLSRA